MKNLNEKLGAKLDRTNLSAGADERADRKSSIQYFEGWRERL